MAWIDRFKKGDKSRTPMHADAINEIVNAVNVLINLEVSPNWIGALRMGDQNAILDLDSLVAYIDGITDLPAPPKTGISVIRSNAGSAAWESDLELDNSASVIVGESELTDGDLDLGTSGTVTINGHSYSPITVKGCDGSGNEVTYEILGRVVT